MSQNWGAGVLTFSKQSQGRWTSQNKQLPSPKRQWHPNDKHQQEPHWTSKGSSQQPYRHILPQNPACRRKGMLREPSKVQGAFKDTEIGWKRVKRAEEED